MADRESEDVLLLDCPIKKYDWGSASAIPLMMGLAQSQEPMAECWMGAHPSASSFVGEQSLKSLIEQRPEEFLGADVSKRFGRLPFLMKILAAERALSIQTHPTLAQAQSGHQRENTAGVPLDDLTRIYKDASDKPELLVALTSFEVLCGFRPMVEVIAELTKRNLEALLPNERLVSDEALYRDVVKNIFALSPDSLAQTLSTLESELSDDSRDRCLKKMCQDRPGDVGILMSLLLHHETLQPGQGIFLEPGVLHAYVQGVGIEIMANSDNVIRAGFTSKHVDRDELLRIAKFKAFDFKGLTSQKKSSGWNVFKVPTNAFELALSELKTDKLVLPRSHGPQIVWLQSGKADLVCGGKTLVMTPLNPCFIKPGKLVELSGVGQCYLARMPLEK